MFMRNSLDNVVFVDGNKGTVIKTKTCEVYEYGQKPHKQTSYFVAFEDWGENGFSKDGWFNESEIDFDDTCEMHIDEENILDNLFECSTCGHFVETYDNYCPFCGRKIIEDEER